MQPLNYLNLCGLERIRLLNYLNYYVVLVLNAWLCQSCMWIKLKKYRKMLIRNDNMYQTAFQWHHKSMSTLYYYVIHVLGICSNCKRRQSQQTCVKTDRQQEVEEYVQKEGCQLNRTSDTHRISKLKLCIQKEIGKNMWSILGMLLDSGNVDYVVGVV